MITESIVSSFEKNNWETICIGRNEFYGKDLLDIRVFVQGVDDELIPSQKGISLNMKYFNELLDGVRALEDALGDERLVARISKNSCHEIRIAATKYRSQDRIDIRTYYLRDNEYIPTKKGISISADLYPQLLAGIEKLVGNGTLKHIKFPENFCRSTREYLLDEHGFLITEEGLDDREINYGTCYAE